VAVAAAGTATAVLLAHGSRACALTALLVVGGSGLLGIEIVNEVQYGTLSLTGPPAKVWWCGDTYQPSAAASHGLGGGDGPPFVQVLTTPAAYSVYAMDNRASGASCGATGPLLVQIGQGEYTIYNP
jgi:hypothetical protein